MPWIYNQRDKDTCETFWTSVENSTSETLANPSASSCHG